MNRTLKRVLGLTASVLLGLAGAVTFASAAQAHHTEVSYKAECLDDGGWQVTWSVTDWNWKSWDKNLGAGEITKVTASESAELVGGIVPGAKLPYPTGNDKLTATQTFDASVTSATLTVDAKWKNKQKGTGTKTAYPPQGGCEPTPDPTPEVTYDVWSDCFSLHIWVGNGNPEKLATFTIAPSTGEPFEVTPEAGGDGYYESFAAPEDGSGLTVAISADGELIDNFVWSPASNCEWGTYVETCDGIEFNLAVPEDGVETTFTFTTSESDEPIVHVLAPGDTLPVSFEGSVDLVVYLVIEQGKEVYSFDFEWSPEDCESPAPSESESPSPAPQLPTTGSSLSIMIGSAAALIVAAAAILLIMRRRRAAQDW